MERSPGSKPGAKVLCERVEIHGLSRLKNLEKYAHSVKVKVSFVDSSIRPPNVEVCFHRNASLGIGMCAQGQWEKLTKGSWSRSMSPFDHKLLDIRTVGSYSGTLEATLHEDFFFHRPIFLVLGMVLMMFAASLSNSLVFYYSGAMVVGILLVVLLVLFQGMKLLPTGRKNSLAIVLYSSIVGVGSFLLSYVPRLLRSVLVDLGIGEDVYNPLAIFLLAFIVLAGAWLGFWVVRKFVLTEDGSIDVGVSHFVSWSIRIFASIMILQSSADPLLAIEALLCGVMASSILKRIALLRFVIHLFNILLLFRDAIHVGITTCRDLFGTDKHNDRISSRRDSSPAEDSYGKYGSQRPRSPLTSTPRATKTRTSQLSESETFYSTFHNTPERKQVSKEEWEKFTKESTKKALKGLVSSPDFSKWAVAHADRITLRPKEDGHGPPRRWLPWF